MTNFDLDARIDALLGELYEPLVHEDGTFRAPVKALLRDFAEAITPQKAKAGGNIEFVSNGNAYSRPAVSDIGVGHNAAIDQIQQNTKQLLGK